MAETTSFHVVPVAGQWDIKRNGSVVSTFINKEHAVARAHDMARRCAPSRLVIFTYNRSVEEEASYREPVGARTA